MEESYWWEKAMLSWNIQKEKWRIVSMAVIIHSELVRFLQVRQIQIFWIPLQLKKQEIE